MAEAVVIIGGRQAQKLLRDVPRQVRYAASRAINDTAKAVQSFTVRTLLPQKFTLRAKGAPWQKPGNKLGFNIAFARPERLAGEVGSRADWLRLHEDGGTKKVQGHQIAVESGARPSKTSVLPTAIKPRNLAFGKRPKKRNKIDGSKMEPGTRLKNKAFVIKTKRGHRAILQRVGGQTKLLWHFKPSTKIKANLEFETTGALMARKMFPLHFNRQFLRAIQTVK